MITTKQLTITFNVSFYSDVELSITDGALEKEVLEYLNEWDDGRYIFASELIREGLQRIANLAVRQNVSTRIASDFKEVKITDATNTNPKPIPQTP